MVLYLCIRFWDNYSQCFKHNKNYTDIFRKHVVLFSHVLFWVDISFKDLVLDEMPFRKEKTVQEMLVVR